MPSQASIGHEGAILTRCDRGTVTFKFYKKVHGDPDNHVKISGSRYKLHPNSRHGEISVTRIRAKFSHHMVDLDY